MLRIYTKLLGALIFFLLIVSSFVFSLYCYKEKQDVAYLISVEDNMGIQNAINTFRFVNQLLRNDFKVFLIGEEIHVNNNQQLTLKSGDFIIPPQSHTFFSSSQDFLYDIIKKLSQETNVSVTQIYFNFKVAAFPLKKPVAQFIVEMG